MQTGDIAIVRCPMNYANRQLQNEVVKVLKIWDLGNMADVRILSGVHKGERWQFVLSHLRKRAQQSMHPTSGYWDASEGEKSPEVLSVTVSDSTHPTCG